MGRFSYSPLPGPSWIRLIRVHMDRLDRLSLDIQVTELDSALRYHSLSYCWGESQESVDLPCGGATISITKTLFSALWHVKKYYDVETIWADQVCINQADLAEKSQQVQRMGDIFRNANTVWAWLGPENADTAVAIDMISSLKLLQTAHSSMGPRPRISGELLKACGLPAHNSEDWKKVANFYNAPYFRRVWIVQELAVAQNAIAICGNRVVPWNDVAIAAVELTLNLKSLDILQNGTGAAAAIYYAQMGQTLFAIQHLLQMYRHFDATDPRDKVFALLGIAPRCSIRPDYTKSVEAVYLETAQNILEESELLDLLSVVAYTEAPENHLPSWVPDWRKKYGPIPLQSYVMRGPEPQLMFMANRGLNSSHPGAKFLGELLVVRGFVVDRVTIVSDPFFMGPVSSLSLRGHHTPMARMAAFITKYQDKIKCLEGEDQQTTLALTLTTGRKATGPFIDDKEGHVRDFYAVMNRWLLARRTTEPISLENKIQLYIFMIVLLFLAIKSSLPPALLAMSFLVLNINFGQKAWYFVTYHWHRQRLARIPFFKELKRSFPTGDADGYQLAMQHAFHFRSLMITLNGRLCVVPIYTRAGDIVVVLCDAVVPFVLREEGHRFILVGECYVHGIMFGESVKDSSEIREFVIR